MNVLYAVEIHCVSLLKYAALISEWRNTTTPLIDFLFELRFRIWDIANERLSASPRWKYKISNDLGV